MSEETEHPFRLSLKEIPTGMKSIPNETVEDAIRVMRLINTSRLHDFQTQINDCMSKLQDLTADPKADVAMGRVGR